MTEHRRDYNAAELEMIATGKGEEAKVSWTNRHFGEPLSPLEILQHAERSYDLHAKTGEQK